MSIGQEAGSWRELGRHTSTAAVLAGGVLVGAITIYVAASLLPTAVQEIGGRRLYAWTMTAFLVAQVVATMLVGRSLSRFGGKFSYLLGFGVFAAGSVLCAASPSMPVLLIGRGTQGLGAGLLTGLGFALIHSALPPRLWSRGSALISAMFGIGNFTGPALGGFSAQFGSWRSAFAILAVAAGVLAIFVPRALPDGERPEQPPVPVRSLALIVGAAGAVSVAGILSDVLATTGFLALGLVLVCAFLVTENRAAASVLPGSVYRKGSRLRWIYLTIMVLASGVAVETFLPLFGQRLGGLPPAAAGFFAAALSLGWSVSQLVSASSRKPRRLVLAGPACLAAGFALLGLSQTEQPPLPVVLAWLPVLFFGGTGIGIAMPHLSVAAMTSAPDGEGGQAAAAIATILTMSTAFGAAIAGLLVNFGGASVVTSARWLLFGFAAISALGVLTARRAI
ncbi:MFS transporter [Amycolatopsis sp. cmx-4-54]|uniref:MFS transporter n=1 Tax=Amycolatopsis sp. cmx-4-54 TaxID=2790936 RepID=UPI00397E80CD